MSKVAIVFWSATGNTETMANCIAEGAGAAATIVPCAEMDAAKLNEYDVVAFGCPAMGAEQLEESEFEPMFAGLEGSLNGKKVALFGSYGWAPGHHELVNLLALGGNLAEQVQPAGDNFLRALILRRTHLNHRLFLHALAILGVQPIQRRRHRLNQLLQPGGNGKSTDEPPEAGNRQRNNPQK